MSGNSLKAIRNRHLFVLDAALLCAAPLLAYALRFEGFDWIPAHRLTALVFAAVSAPIQVSTYLTFGLYRRLWRYASISELELIFLAGASAALLCSAVGLVLLPVSQLTPVRVPVSVIFMNALLSVGIIATPRLLMRIAGWRSGRRRRRRDDHRRVLIAGAGVAGELIVRELCSNQELRMNPIGFVDDDLTKHGMRLAGLPVFGPLADIPQIVEREHVHELLIAMPRASGAVVRQVVRAAFDVGVKTRTVPALFEILSERVGVTALREVEIDDLLRREPVQTDLAAVSALATGRTVLVTGAGGSIGSELCRQLAALAPDKLILVDHSENSIFETRRELLRAEFRSTVVPVIADIRDHARIHQVFESYNPYAVFHAAAHKHVPLMEENVAEAITNNVLGTRNVVDAAVGCGTEYFVLISTDKAVRPTNVMGATKRIAEFIVHDAAMAHKRNFVSVRFGNVLGSQGSVVPTFLQQIREGGPVTVTHPEMRRYFMTIPEAVQLVLQAGALGRGGELFMLDMGEPVKIVDLARDMIRLSGYEEGTEIQIEFTGIRPGEKLFEEMFFSHEIAEPTEHPKILRARNGQSEYGGAQQIHRLIDAARNGADDACLRRMLHEIVPDFTNGSVTDNGRVDKSEAQHIPTLEVLPRLIDERGTAHKPRRAVPSRTLTLPARNADGDISSAAASD
jgi:FlaA1/EpsC-like NDP-sugar epimerase